MPSSASLTIELEPELRDRFERAAALAERSSADIVRDLIEEFVERGGTVLGHDNSRSQAVDELRKAWDAGIVSGPPIDGEEAFDRIRARLEKHIASHEA